MLVNMNSINLQVKEFISGRTERAMKVNGSTDCLKGKGLRNYQMVLFLMECGKRTPKRPRNLQVSRWK